MKNSIKINGKEVEFQQGDTIFSIAEANNIYIPHLCHHHDYPPQGNCKLCTVKVDDRLSCACTTEAVEGMQVETESTELSYQRRTLTELLFAEGNHHCPGCERAGNCQLQATAYAQGMLFNHFSQHDQPRKLDASHPDILLDRDRCILCGLCVRASHMDGKHLFSIKGRGCDSHLSVNSASGLLGDTDMATTDRAANICPVGAILVRGEGFSIPIGERLYDQQSIANIGNQRPTYNLISSSNQEDGDLNG